MWPPLCSIRPHLKEVSGPFDVYKEGSIAAKASALSYSKAKNQGSRQ